MCFEWKQNNKDNRFVGARLEADYVLWVETKQEYPWPYESYPRLRVPFNDMCALLSTY